mgnify:CR=1 FL=1
MCCGLKEQGPFTLYSFGNDYSMVRIRLRRVGAKGHPFYRIVIADQRTARNGRFIDQIGTYDHMKDPPEIKMDEDAARKWLRNGAQPSDAVEHMLKGLGITAKVKSND